MDREELKQKIHNFITFEARACSMDPALVTPEYVFRMWGEKVPLEEIKAAMAKGDQGIICPGRLFYNFALQ